MYYRKIAGRSKPFFILKQSVGSSNPPSRQPRGYI